MTAAFSSKVVTLSVIHQAFSKTANFYGHAKEFVPGKLTFMMPACVLAMHSAYPIEHKLSHVLICIYSYVYCIPQQGSKAGSYYDDSTRRFTSI